MTAIRGLKVSETCVGSPEVNGTNGADEDRPSKQSDWTKVWRCLDPKAVQRQLGFNKLRDRCSAEIFNDFDKCPEILRSSSGRILWPL